MARWIVETSLRLRYFVVILAVGMIALGVLQLPTMPVDAFPEFNPPMVEIQTEALGLSASEMEAFITVPLEADLLNGVAWLDQIYSETVPGLSSVLLIFEPGTDPIEARQMVQERLTQTFALPSVSKPPIMLQPLSTTQRVMMVGVDSQELSLIDLGVLARWTIRPRLMGVPGVANVAVWGLREWQLQVQVDPAHLQDVGVTLDQVIETTGEALWVSPLSYLQSSTPGTAGWIDTPNQRLGIQHILPISSAEELMQVSVNGTAYQLGDVANIVEDHQPLIGDALISGEPGLLLVIEKFPGASTFEVTRGVEEALQLLAPGLQGVDIDTTVFRPATYFEFAASNLSTTGLISLVLIFLVLAFFLNDWRLVLVSLVTIVFAMVAATFVLYTREATFNMMVLAGLAAVLAIVVDEIAGFMLKVKRQLNADEGEKITLSAMFKILLDTQNGMGFATVVIVLLITPLFLFEGLLNNFINPLVVTYLIGLFAAILSTLIIAPGLTALLVPLTPNKKRVSSFGQKLQDGYKSALAKVVEAPTAILLIVGVIFVVGVILIPISNVKFLPALRKTNLRIEWEGVPGTSRPEMMRITSLAVDELSQIPGVTNAGAHFGRAITGDAVVNVNSGEIWLTLDPNADYDATTAAVREVMSGYPGFFHETKNYRPDRTSEVFEGTNRELVVRLFGFDYDLLNSKAQEIRQRLLTLDNVSGVSFETVVQEPQIDIMVNLDAAERYQIKPGDVRRAATTLISGLHVGSLYEEQKVFDVVVWGIPEIRQNFTNLSELMIDTPGGGHVNLNEVANLQVNSAPTLIQRDAVSRYIDIRVDVSGGLLGSTASDIAEAIKDINMPFEYHVEVLDDYALHQASYQQVITIAVVAVLGSFLFMQAAFRSWGLAFFTMLSWPVAISGGLLSVLLLGNTLSLGSLIGLFAVLTITIRGSMLVIGHFQELEDQGSEFGPEIVLKSPENLLAPILMTALTVALAFLPVVIMGNIPGLEILYPMAIAVIFGLVQSALLNLFIVPLIYLKFGSNREPAHGLQPVESEAQI